MAFQPLLSAVDKLVHSLRGRRCGPLPLLRTSEELQDEKGGAVLEEINVLLKLLQSSPWQQDLSCSSQALALQELAASTPDHLKANAIYSFFTTLRFVGKGVSVVDEGLLRFCCLEELVLSANNITELHMQNLPKTLRVLELYGNQISRMKNLHTHPLPHLQHLSLGHNRLGSPEHVQYFTTHSWPQLMSLDLSWCGFPSQNSLLEVLTPLPRLRSLALQGNPLTLSFTYPAVLLDTLTLLLYLDGRRVTLGERRRFGGLSKLRGSQPEGSKVTVCIRRMRGVPPPALMTDEGAPDFRYSVCYEFLHQPQPQDDVLVEECTLQDVPQRHAESVTSVPVTDSLTTGEQNLGISRTSKQEWAEVIELNHSRTHHVTDLAELKNFFIRGLWLTVEEEKVLSRPEAPEEHTGTKTSADKKGQENTEGAQKIKDKKKRKDSMPNLIPEAPVQRTLASVHVELKDLLEGKVEIQKECDLGLLVSEQTVRTSVSRDKEQKKPKDEKKEDRRTKSSGDGTSGRRSGTSSKGRGKGQKESRTDDESFVSSRMEPLTVELSVELVKWPPTPQASSEKSPK